MVHTRGMTAEAEREAAAQAEREAADQQPAAADTDDDEAARPAPIRVAVPDPMTAAPQAPPLVPPAPPARQSRTPAVTSPVRRAANQGGSQRRSRSETAQDSDHIERLSRDQQGLRTEIRVQNEKIDNLTSLVARFLSTIGNEPHREAAMRMPFPLTEQDEDENLAAMQHFAELQRAVVEPTGQKEKGSGRGFFVHRWTYQLLTLVGIATATVARNPHADEDFVRFMEDPRALEAVETVANRVTVIETDENFGPVAKKFRAAIVARRPWVTKANSVERLILAEYVSIFMALSKRGDTFSIYALRQVVLKLDAPESIQEASTKPSILVGYDRVTGAVMLRLRTSMTWASTIVQLHQEELSKATAKQDQAAYNVAQFNMEQDLVGNTFVSVEQYDQMMTGRVVLIRSVFDRDMPITQATSESRIEGGRNQQRDQQSRRGQEDHGREARRAREPDNYRQTNSRSRLTGPHWEAVLKRCKRCLRPRHPPGMECPHPVAHPQYVERQPWHLLDCMSHRDPGYPDITRPETLPQ